MPEIYPCKINGCEETTTVTRGAYAFRCKEHRMQLSAEMRANGKISGRKKAPESPKLKDSVLLLAGIAERIDTSAASFRQSKNQLITDIGEFTHRLDSIRRELTKLVKDNAN